MKSKNIAGNKKTGKILFEAGILIMIVNLLSVYGIWQSILNGWRIQGGELCFQAFIKSGGKYVITYLNQESIYISFLSVLFSFLGNKEEIVSIINLILQAGGVFFFYLGAKNLFRFVFPLALTFIAGLLSICFYPVITDSSMHLIWCLSGLVFWFGSKSFVDVSGKFLKRIFLGIFVGILCYIDLTGFFLLTTFLLFILITKEFDLKEKKIQFLHFVWFLLAVINGFFVMFYLWNNFKLNKDTFSYWLNDKLSYFMYEEGLNQYICLGLILIISMIFYAIKHSGKSKNISKTETITVNETQILIDETKNTKVPSSQPVTHKEEVLEETAMYEPSEEEVVAVEIIAEAPEPKINKPIKFIENPLPLPKKHVKKEMTYAFEPTKEQMHYDLNNYRLDDDYDLKDT